MTESNLRGHPRIIRCKAELWQQGMLIATIYGSSRELVDQAAQDCIKELFPNTFTEVIHKRHVMGWESYGARPMTEAERAEMELATRNLDRDVADALNGEQGENESGRQHNHRPLIPDS